jgi:hypothetical protein
MGLFRQLPLAPLVDMDSLDLRGEPWGQVNYWWDGDGRDMYLGHGECRHIVWQAGPVLQRSIVYSRLPLWKEKDWKEEAQEAQQKLYLRLLRDGCQGREIDSPVWPRKKRVEIGGHLIDVQMEDERILTAEIWRDYVLDPPEARVAREAEEWLQHHPGTTELPDYVQRNNSHRLADMRTDQCRGEALFATLKLERTSPAQWVERFREAETSYSAYRTLWEQRYAALAALPQLFIAV